MERARLRPGEVLVEDGEDALADDARLEQPARVDADDAGAVGQRVEVVGTRLAVVRLRALGRPDRGVPELGEVDPVPLARVLGVRTDEQADLAERRRAGGPDRPAPAADEVDLVRGDERRRAQVEDVRGVRVEPDLALELTGRRARRPVEPVVEALCSRQHDPIARDPVHLLELGPLDVVPDERAVGDEAQQALAAEVVPARDADAGADAELARALQVLDLGRRELDHGAREHDVGPLLRDERGDAAARRNRLLQTAKPRQGARREGCVGAGREAVDPTVQRRLEERREAAEVEPPVQLRGDALPQRRGVGEARFAVSGQVGQRADEPREAAPAVASRPGGGQRVRHRRTLRRQLLDQPEVARVLLQPPERDVDLVALAGEQPDRAAVVAQVAGMEEREEDAHIRPAA